MDNFNNKRKIKYAIIYKFFIIAISLQISTVLAADVSTEADLRALMISAVQSRTETFKTTYDGSPLTMQTLLNEFLFIDDYLRSKVKISTVTTTSNKSYLTCKFKFDYWDTLENQAVVDQKVAEILSTIIKTDMNVFQKEKAIHDWIVGNVIFDTSLVYHSDYTALISPYKTVCQGYALLAYKMLNEAGIPARIVIGTGSGIAHSWNMVQLDGAWYHLDCTFDDTIPDVKDKVIYTYYNLTDTQIKKDHSWAERDNFNLPVADTQFDTIVTSKLAIEPDNKFYKDLSSAIGLQSDTVDNSEELNVKLLQAIFSNEKTLVFKYTGGKSNISNDIKDAVIGTSLTSYSYTAQSCLRSSNLEDIMVTLQITYQPINTIHEKSINVSQATVVPIISDLRLLLYNQ